MEIQTSPWIKLVEDDKTTWPRDGQRCWVREVDGMFDLGMFDELWMMFRDEDGNDAISFKDSTHWAPANPPAFDYEAMTLEKFKKEFPEYSCIEVVDGRPSGIRLTKSGEFISCVYIGFLGGFFVIHPKNGEALIKQTPSPSVDSIKAKLDKIAADEFGGWETFI